MSQSNTRLARVRTARRPHVSRASARRTRKRRRPHRRRRVRVRVRTSAGYESARADDGRRASGPIVRVVDAVFSESRVERPRGTVLNGELATPQAKLLAPGATF